MSVHVLTGPNAYPGACRNRGVMASSGGVLMFLDDDDWLLPGGLETLWNAYQASGIDLIIPFYQSDRDGPLYGFAGLTADGGLFHNLMGGAVVMLSRATFDRLGGYREHHGVGKEDYALLARAQAAGLSWTICPEPVFGYRAHADRIRAKHADWNQTRILQGGFWRMLNERATASGEDLFTLAYARQLHDVATHQFLLPDVSISKQTKAFLIHQIFRRLGAKFSFLRGLNAKRTVKRR